MVSISCVGAGGPVAPESLLPKLVGVLLPSGKLAPYPFAPGCST